MNTIKAWFNKYKISTHSVVVAVGVLVGAYAEVPVFHQLVLSVYGALPKWAEELAAAAIAVYTWYRNGQKSIA